MRKLLAALLLAAPSLAAAQVTDWQTWPVSWRRWDAGTVLTLGYTTIANDDVAVTQRSILNIVGGGCVDDAATVSTDCTFGGGGGGVATDPIWDAAGDLAVGTGANTAARMAVGVEGQVLAVNSSGAVSWSGAGNTAGGGTTAGPCAPTRNTTCFFEDFYSRGVNAPGTANNAVGQMYSFGSSAAGLINPGVAGTTAFADGNHPGNAALSTGTGVTGWGVLFGGSTGNQTAVYPSIVLNGGEIFETVTYVPNLSTGVDLFKNWWGWGDSLSATAAPTNGLYFYYDGSVSSGQIGCGAASASGGAATETLSNLTLTATAWHTLRIEVNSGATSVAYIVDGTPLSCSPLTTDIPSASGEVTAVQIRIGAHAGALGCDTAQDCQVIMDYVYFFDPTITR